MAKLSARGRKELFRMVRKSDGSRTTYAFMTDGNVLRKSDVRSDYSDKWYSGTWKLIPEGKMVQDEWEKYLTVKGFSKVTK